MSAARRGHRTRRWTAGRLLWRRARTRPAATVLVAALVLLSLIVAAAVPRLVERQSAAELDYQLRSIGATARSLQGVTDYRSLWPTEPPPNADQLYGAIDQSLKLERLDYPEPLYSAVGEPNWLVQMPRFKLESRNGAPVDLGLQLTAAEDYLTRIRIVEGGTPSTWTESEADLEELEREAAEREAAAAGEPGEATSGATAVAPIDILVSTSSATAMGLKPGDLLGASAAANADPEVPVTPLRYRVSGLYEPIDKGDQYWLQFADLLPATEILPYMARPYLSTAAFVDPLTIGRFTRSLDGAKTRLYYPVSADALNGADPDLLLRQLSTVVSLGITLPDQAGQLNLGTRTDDAIEEALARGRTLAGLLAMLAAAPAGVMLAVLLLGIQAVVRGRRSDLVLAAARGAGELRLRLLMTLEGALISIPAGVIVTALATLLLPTEQSAVGFVLPAIVAVAPPALYGLLADSRPDAGRTGSLLSRLRAVAELAVVLLTAASLFLLIRRGLSTSGQAVGVDPLLSAVPLLLAVTVGIAVLRGFPVPLRGAVRSARGRRGVEAFVGSIRATRVPTLGLAGVLALVVGLSIATFSAVMLTTFDTGIERAAAESVGADARVDAPLLTADELDAVTQVDGVEHVAGIQLVGPRTLGSGDSDESITIVLSPTAELGTLRTLPARLDAEQDGRIPVLLSDDLKEEFTEGSSAIVSGQPLTVVGFLPADSQLGPTHGWILVDSSFSDRMSVQFSPSVLLIGADPALLPQLKAPLEAAVHAGAVDQGTVITRSSVSTVPTMTALRKSEPSILGVRIGLGAGALLSVLLCSITLVLSTIAAGRERGRVAGILRTLGLPRRRLRSLIAWELGPVALVSLLAGAVLGLVLPYIVTAAVDLRPFTEGTAPVAPVLDPTTIVGVLALFSMVVLGSGIVAVAIGDRIAPSTTLKMGSS
ncbi:ABC transporter permease [Naasia lichenicola]|uniref:ABC transporter permease n=1 Tax=Naasia lichenicola TaxID=2565933 RepID=A0A4V3WT81_9MICO|nr:ABC transporter permease [Naasia lichenicola]THG30987.1 ABC transporter permease [Naasia lichenicola]